MLCKTILIIATCLAAVHCQQTCPSGGQIYELGITANGKNEVINAHNYYRLAIAQGRVPGQPRGTNLLRQYYDNQLGQEGRVVSLTCKMDHIRINDSRFQAVGQNLAIRWSSRYEPNVQNWTEVVTSWFNEYKNYRYYSGSTNGKKVGHYTQVVWHDSRWVGCDFIYFQDVNRPQTPYAKLYTCNYGPAGNTPGEPPYATDGSGCPNLC